MAPHQRPFVAKLTQADLQAHLLGVQQAIESALVSRDGIERDMTTPRPGVRERDRWRFRLFATIEVDERGMQHVGAYSIDLLLDQLEDPEVDDPDIWGGEAETLTRGSAQQVTAALATWLLAHGWRCNNPPHAPTDLLACEAIDCEITTVGETAMRCSQRMRGDGIAVFVAPPHWERASTAHEAYRAAKAEREERSCVVVVGDGCECKDPACELHPFG
jgi:hypothetical protein